MPPAKANRLGRFQHLLGLGDLAHRTSATATCTFFLDG